MGAGSSYGAEGVGTPLDAFRAAPIIARHGTTYIVVASLWLNSAEESSPQNPEYGDQRRAGLTSGKPVSKDSATSIFDKKQSIGDDQIAGPPAVFDRSRPQTLSV